ncbi:MAG TPA: hypothetical protein VNT20_11090 [Flavisolibacter sp.]|jgi:hypothetical protein|nr:hypothetical protein [Flavisolibacter sp.]
MKRSGILLFALVIFATLSHAQEVIKVQSCNDTLIQRQVDSLKILYSKAGYNVLREASITMESEYEMPVVVQLQERALYQVVFIGDITSRLYEVRMYDWDEKMVVYQKKMWGDVDGNIISYGYQPKFTEFHMIKPVQVNKKRKKGLCGYIMLLQKVRA